MGCALGVAHSCPDGRAFKYFAKAMSAPRAKKSGVKTVDTAHQSTKEVYGAQGDRARTRSYPRSLSGSNRGGSAMVSLRFAFRGDPRRLPERLSARELRRSGRWPGLSGRPLVRSLPVDEGAKLRCDPCMDPTRLLQRLERAQRRRAR